MIKRQVDKLKKHIQGQARAIFKIERRKNSPKRTFLESMFREQVVTKDREVAMTLYTQVLRRLNVLMLNDKKNELGIEEIIDMIKDEN